MLNWYLVQLKPNGHKLAKANLERQGFNTFLPLQNVTKRTAQKFMDRTVPLFAGYMFVELDVAQNSWRKVNSTLGVARIVSLGGTPTPVPYSIMNQLISRCDRDGILRPSQGVVVGQDVQVLRGPFSNFVAKVEEIESDRRVWVLIDMLGQSSRISFPQMQLRMWVNMLFCNTIVPNEEVLLSLFAEYLKTKFNSKNKVTLL
jgi:transcriptional antiterminator RfaH